MNNLRNSIFNKVLAKCEKNKFAKEICFTIIKSGFGDVVYRTFSKKYLKDRQEFYKKNEERVKNNINCLEDELSKTIYKKMIKYRCERKRKDFPKDIEKNRYFPKDIIKLNDDEVFIDCGAYTGDTIEDFIQAFNNKYKKIVCFEPDKNNFEILKKNMEHIKNIKMYCMGVYNKVDTLNFCSGKKEGSGINYSGNDTVNVVNLDSLEDCQEATFIKMDIEGAELDALKGAEAIIKKNRPKLAICIYHSDQDMIDIIEYIHNLNSEYKIYLRHHHPLYEGETVIYCV